MTFLEQITYLFKANRIRADFKNIVLLIYQIINDIFIIVINKPTSNFSVINWGDKDGRRIKMFAEHFIYWLKNNDLLFDREALKS